MTDKRPRGGAKAKPPDASLEQDYRAALHSHFRAHGPDLIEELAKEPAAYFRQVGAAKDRARTDDAIDRMTEEELDRELYKLFNQRTFKKKNAEAGSD